ncbi:MAG: HhH-GPD-type base excision DNA repair protein [Actinomycetota bacterium]
MPKALWFTNDEEAAALLAQDPFAPLVGFAIDQQVPVQTAFAGPLKLKQRAGTLDPKQLAKTDLDAAFREKPAIHRFPGAMATRVQELAQHIVDEYGGDAAKLWKTAKTPEELKRRLEALPGFGEMKVKSTAAVLAKQFGVKAAEPIAPKHPTLGDVDSLAKLDEYQAWKREYKRAARA